jgi:signal transduction histidine kinase
VRIDRDRFVQALTNVLSNAYKYSPQGGAIELRLDTRRRSEQDWVGVAVRDHGIGMSAEEQQHLFERFFRARPAGQIPGTGLGMSMIKKIIDGHGGMVEVDSAPGRGTEVTLWLPLAD